MGRPVNWKEIKPKNLSYLNLIHSLYLVGKLKDNSKINNISIREVIGEMR